MAETPLEKSARVFSIKPEISHEKIPNESPSFPRKKAKRRERLQKGEKSTWYYYLQLKKGYLEYSLDSFNPAIGSIPIISSHFITSFHHTSSNTIILLPTQSHQNTLLLGVPNTSRATHIPTSSTSTPGHSSSSPPPQRRSSTNTPLPLLLSTYPMENTTLRR